MCWYKDTEAGAMIERNSYLNQLLDWKDKNIIKVLTDKGDVDVPDMPIVEQNKYQSVTLAIPDGASYIQFTSEESTNTSGYRIDNVSLTGIAK